RIKGGPGSGNAKTRLLATGDAPATGLLNGNKRSAVRKFDLGYSHTEFPAMTGSCDRSHRLRKNPGG
ncbi:hypothetical protein, partial [Streptomyces ureilyticus]|uniref:hypothetical protein n=1 Tax=Streptomyces ureilyticus TaxID=1775131 RepID=UPI0019D16095